MNLKNEINSRFMGVASKLDRLAELTTQEVQDLHSRMNNIENAMSLMQNALVNIEKILMSVLEEDENGRSEEKE